MQRRYTILPPRNEDFPSRLEVRQRILMAASKLIKCVEDKIFEDNIFSEKETIKPPKKSTKRK